MQTLINKAISSLETLANTHEQDEGRDDDWVQYQDLIRMLKTSSDPVVLEHALCEAWDCCSAF